MVWLRAGSMLVPEGQCMADAIAQLGVSQVTLTRAAGVRRGPKTEQIERLKDLALEGSRLRKAVSDLALDKRS